MTTAITASRGGRLQPPQEGLDGGESGHAGHDEGGGQGAEHAAEHVQRVVIAEVDPAGGDRDRVQALMLAATGGGAMR